MGTYNLPRNVKGEGRILFIFTKKSILWTAGFAAAGLIFFLIFSAIGYKTVGIIIIAVFGSIGLGIGSLRIPNITTISWMSKNAGQTVDDVILRAIKFRQKGNKKYIYIREEDIK